MQIRARCIINGEPQAPTCRRDGEPGSPGVNAVETELDTAMSLSREIIVLDFGDEATSPYDFDRTTPQPGGNCKFSAFFLIGPDFHKKIIFQ